MKDSTAPIDTGVEDDPAMLLADANSDDAVPQVEAFRICDEKTANWLVKKIVQLREYGERVKKWAADELERTHRSEERLLYLFGGQLETWAVVELQKLKGRKKTLHLPGGQIGFRHEAARLVIVDDEAVLAWAREHCAQAVETVERLLKTPIYEHFSSTGEIPPGSEVQPARDKFFVR